MFPIVDDENDADLVIDYLSEDQSITPKCPEALACPQDIENYNDLKTTGAGSVIGSARTNGSHNSDAITNNHSNMVPIISVTPHSPGAKFNFLEDTLNQLQCLRESVAHMKNTTLQNTALGGIGSTVCSFVVSSTKLFSSCPSLPDLTIANPINVWPHHHVLYGLNNDRRKSWTAIEDLTECTKSSHKSVSLSSLDSEEQESLRAAERLHNRTSRNSTGGISTHSLNEAELARDFEKVVAKRNLVPVVPRIPLQKSISTPSIAPVRNQNVKEDNLVSHLSDSEDETHDRSLLCVRDKNEEYPEHHEKRRKRGSLFFRKKKDKSKTKGQSSVCDACGAVINLATYKEHAVECKAKIAKENVNSNLCIRYLHCSYSDDVPLIRDEFLHEAPIGPHDLGAEPILGVAIDEHDSWSPSVPKEVVKALKDKQVKRQEHIYEFIMTEKHHVQTLLVMQKVFVESLQKHFSHLNLERMFPRLVELTELHTGFLRKLRLKQREHHVVDSIADILLDFFSSMSAQKLKSAYGEFCSNHRSALDTFKCYMTGDNVFAEWYKHCQQNPLLKKKGIPECILFVTQRLTKYPLLIDPLLKSSREDKIEQEKLQKAMSLVKEILVDVDARVADKEKEDRQLEIFKRIDAKSCATFKKDKFKKSDIISCNRKLRFEGVATLMQGRSKMQTVLVVVLSDCLFFLLENSHKYSFFTPENKAGVVSLQKLLIREKAGTESRGIYIISSNPAYPEMYELKVQNPKDKNVWIQSIRAAVIDCPSDESEAEDYMSMEQRQKIIDLKQANMREIICKMRQKDFEQAILLEEKIALQLSLLLDNEQNAEQLGPAVESFISNYGSYRDLISDDCDTIEIWKRVLNSIQEISSLASSLYTAATGLPLSRSSSSVGERQSELFISPTLPKRAETFGGFDERRSKQLITAAGTGGGNLTMHSKREQQTNAHSSSSPLDNYAALHVSHHLHTLLCIISQQMTTIQSLQHQLNNYRENPKTLYRHNDQLEELRNLQDKLQEEKTAWQKQKEQEERELEETKKSQKAQQEQIRAEQEDIRQQREQLYRKMEILSSQGLLLSPSVALPIPTGVVTSLDEALSVSEEHHVDSAFAGSIPASSMIGSSVTIDRKKDKWRTASITKTPPANLVSATNAAKINATNIKQQLPLKLSSLSSTKAGSTACNMVMSPNSGNVAAAAHGTNSGVTQMFPLKLADKKVCVAFISSTGTPNHSRTGSSPAVIQQQIQVQSGNPATRYVFYNMVPNFTFFCANVINVMCRTNTYPKIPERFRLRSSDNYPLSSGTTANSPVPQTYQYSPSTHSMGAMSSTPPPLVPARNTAHHESTGQRTSSPISSRHPSLQSPPKSSDTTTSKSDSNNKAKEEEVMYF
ncbi:AGAP007712-PA [Anopheles gambiae str. PEST]|uniref:AGAP007712-PA n=1 Tax=Anopheles gambiae TaxID=7165 RepID=Q7QJX4_ANOGA|nr:AGAP007712-PA [Anopheles gambiae str. PEST]